MINSADAFRAYSSNFVNYGDVYIAIDDYADKVNLTSLAGFVDGWPNTTDRITWNSNAKWPLELKAVFLDLGVQAAVTRDWINFGAIQTTTLPGDLDIQPPLPEYAHFTHAFAKHTVGTSSRIQLSLTFMVIVISCNIVKLTTMLWVVFMEKSDYLVTVGDGAASFLEHPDSTTEQMCVASRHDIIEKVQSGAKRHSDQLAAMVRESGSTWAKQYSKYSTALDRDREFGSYFM
jgi:hypothetical protein